MLAGLGCLLSGNLVCFVTITPFMPTVPHEAHCGAPSWA